VIVAVVTFKLIQRTEHQAAATTRVTLLQTVMFLHTDTDIDRQRHIQTDIDRHIKTQTTATQTINP